MVKKNTSQLFGMPKFVSLRGRTSGSFEDWRNFGDPEKRRFFLNWGSHFFYTTFWQIFRLNKQKKRSSATWAFLRRSLQDVTWAVYHCSDLSLKRSKVEKTKQKQGAIVPETHFIRLQPSQISRGIIYRATLYNMQNKAQHTKQNKHIM